MTFYFQSYFSCNYFCSDELDFIFTFDLFFHLPFFFFSFHLDINCQKLISRSPFNVVIYFKLHWVVKFLQLIACMGFASLNLSANDLDDWSFFSHKHALEICFGKLISKAFQFPSFSLYNLSWKQWRTVDAYFW